MSGSKIAFSEIFEHFSAKYSSWSTVKMKLGLNLQVYNEILVHCGSCIVKFVTVFKTSVL